VTCNQRVAGHDYPYYVGLYMATEFRARRVATRIEALERGAAGVDDMAAIHADRESLPARAFVARLLAALDAEAPEGLALRAAQRLRGWDFHVDREAVAPAVYHVTRRAATRRLVEHAFGEAAELVWQGVAGTDTQVRLLKLEMDLALVGGRRGDDVLPPDTTWEELLRDAFHAAVVELRRRFGDDERAWAWGQLHQTQGRHPLSAVFKEWGRWLDPPPQAVHGDADTPLAGSFGLGSFTVTGLSVNRYIFDPADWTRSRWIVPGGASGHPASPHYGDQARLHADLEFIPALWDFGQIEAEAESVQRLEPDA
jgi:penicillin amidase